MDSPSACVTVIRPGSLIDGLGGAPIMGAAVLVNGSRILWVGPRQELSSVEEFAPLVEGAGEDQMLDLPHSTLLPGLIDCHTHTNMPGDGHTGEEVNLDTDDIRLLRSARNVRRALESGVTTVCDCGSWNRTAFSLKKAIALGIVDGPRVMVSGPPLTTTGGHLWYMGGEADGVDGVRRQVRWLIKEGADIIKIAASGGSTVTSDPYRPSFNVDEVRAIADEAHRRARPVAAHCRSTVAINNALDAGVDMIFHCSFTDPDGSYRFDQPTAERLARSNVWVNPTHSLGIPRLAELLRKREQEILTVEEVEMLTRIETGGINRKEQFGRLTSMGVKLIGGSDCGWSSFPFGDFQAELISLTDFGLSPTEAILAGTRDAAKAIGMQHSLGTIERAKKRTCCWWMATPWRTCNLCAGCRRYSTVGAVWMLSLGVGNIDHGDPALCTIGK